MTLQYTTPAPKILPLAYKLIGRDYRFGFNAQQKDNEIKGIGNSLDFGARMYDSRLGRWLSLDKASKIYPMHSNYIFAGNSPLHYHDNDGNIIRDKNNNIVFVSVGVGTTRHAGDPNHVFNVEYGYIFTNNGTKIMVMRDLDVQDKRMDTDCHGASFADSKYWINSNQVPTLLKNDGYNEVTKNNRKKGDKVVYTDKNNKVEDSRTVTSDVNKVYGQGGLETSNYTSDINNTWNSPNGPTKQRFFTKTQADVIYTDAQVAQLKNSNTTSDANQVNNRSDNLPVSNPSAPTSGQPVRITPSSIYTITVTNATR